ncbi:MAG: hypothetical protein QM487_07780 [Candidatus Marithrix sp.]
MTKKKKSFLNQPLSAQKANELLIKGKYKEATDIYKKLLKIEQRQEWQAGLAKAYLLRAENLATKGMYKEAVVLWENRAIICNNKELFEQYIYWLVEARYYSRAVSSLMEANTYLSSETLQLLLTKLGILFFKEHSEFMIAFPQDIPLAKHYQIIQQALTAYHQNNKLLCEEYISQIPFRSPYRDFHFIFKALLIIYSDQDLANKLLSKIANDSPYSKFAKLIKLVITPPNINLLTKFAELNLTEREFISDLKGWNKQQFKTITTLKTISQRKISNKIILELLIDNKKTFGEQYVQQSCLAILPTYPSGIKLYEKAFTPLSEFEKNRILALNYEQQDRLLIAKKHWQICIEILTKNRNQNSLKIALIFRHQVAILKQYGEFLDKKYAPEFLIESLNFDPNDKECFLDLILWYKKNKQLKDCYKWIETAVIQLPQDNDILFMAMEAATDRKSFKKALKYAVTLLKTDPINIKALNIASSSHIAHAQKLIKNARYPLAHKELQEATKFERTATGIIQINQGLLELQEQKFIKPIRLIEKREVKPLKPINSKQLQILTKQYPQAIMLLQEGVQLAGGGILGLFQLVIITQKQNIDFNMIYPLVTDPKLKLLAIKNLPTQHEVLELINLINHYAKEGIIFLYDTIEQIKAHILNIIKIKLPKHDMLSLCKCLKNIEHHEILEKFATNSLKRWKQQPAFIFYQIYGIVKGTVWYLSEQQLDKLQKAADNAKQQGDEYTAIMIAKFVEQMYEGIFPKNPFFDSLLDEEKLEAVLEKMETNIDKLEQKDNIRFEEMQEIIKQFEELGMPIASGRKK